jgi:hypothetical protein
MGLDDSDNSGYGLLSYDILMWHTVTDVSEKYTAPFFRV